jgi:hypothetical protein
MWHGLSSLSPLGSTVGLQLVTIVCAAFIALALDPTSRVARLMGSKFLALGGKKYAFAMYMVHPLLLEICTHLPIASKAIRLGLFLTSTTLISGLSYRYYESFFLHLKIGRTKTSRNSVPTGLTPA